MFVFLSDCLLATNSKTTGQSSIIVISIDFFDVVLAYFFNPYRLLKDSSVLAHEFSFRLTKMEFLYD